MNTNTNTNTNTNANANTVSCTFDELEVLAPAEGKVQVEVAKALKFFCMIAQLPACANFAQLETAIKAESAKPLNEWPVDVQITRDSVEWYGTFTRLRFVHLTRDGVIEWDSGTNRPSKYIGWALFDAGIARIKRLVIPTGVSPELAGALTARMV